MPASIDVLVLPFVARLTSLRWYCVWRALRIPAQPGPRSLEI